MRSWDVGVRSRECFFFFFSKQKTAYEIGTGDWSSDVCSSDLEVIVQTHHCLTKTRDSLPLLQIERAHHMKQLATPDRKSVV